MCMHTVRHISFMECFRGKKYDWNRIFGMYLDDCIQIWGMNKVGITSVHISCRMQLLKDCIPFGNFISLLFKHIKENQVQKLLHASVKNFNTTFTFTN